MKKVTTIILLLCSIVVYGQKGVTGLDTTKVKFSSTFTGGTALMGDYFTTPPKTDYYLITTATRTIIKVSAPDSTGLVKVWLNRKEIRWTSDSTFTYKTEQK